VKKFVDQRPVLNALLTGLGIACAALVGMSVVLLFVEALSATRGVMPSPSILPAPEDRRVVAALVLAAMAIGFSRARKHFNRHADFSPWSIAPALVVVVVAVILVGWSRHNEQRYLSRSAALLPYGIGRDAEGRWS
jgi:cobalamin synthase